MKIKQTLKLNSEKKHSVRYDAQTGTPKTELALTSAYISKAVLGNRVPTEITITVEAD